jgi:hypothetical protein
VATRRASGRMGRSMSSGSPEGARRTRGGYGGASRWAL